MTGTHAVPNRQHYDEHTHQADMIPGVSISYRTALKTSILRFPAHPASTLTIHPREIQALRLHNHDTHSYDTVYQVDNSNYDELIYWTMTGTHVVPDRQQYDEHTHQANMIPDVSISYQTTL